MGLLKIRSLLRPGGPWVGQEGPPASPRWAGLSDLQFMGLAYLKASVFQQ